MIVVGIPAYNEEKYVAKVVLRALKYCDEVVVVDDGSKDMTAEIASELGATVLRHQKNMGKGEALRTLFTYCLERGADTLVTLDGDGQHDPQEIPVLLQALNEGYDVVIGSRFLGRADRVPGYRRFGNSVLNRLTNGAALKDRATGARITDTQCGFRAYRVDILDRLMPSERGMGSDSEIAIKAVEHGLSVREVPISVTYGDDTSTYNPIYHTLDVIGSTVKMSTIRHPLLLYGAPGLGILAGGLAVGTYAAAEYLTSRYVSFVLSFLAATLIIAGMLSAFTGVILYTLITVVRDNSRVRAATINVTKSRSATLIESKER